MIDQSLVGKVQTVLGPISPEELGVTLTHEHLLFDSSSFAAPPVEASARGLFYQPVSQETLAYSRYYHVRNLDESRLIDIPAAVEEVMLYKEHGGDSLVEVTSIGLARDPLGLARISRATGINIIMGSSYYVAQSHPADMDSRTEDDIVEEIVCDVTEGAPTSRREFVAATPTLILQPTGIKSGVIGEVGCSWPIADNERKVLRASGRAQRLTGAPLLIHPGRDETAPLEIIEILSEVGADLSRTIMGHLDRTVFLQSTLKQIAASGCYLEWDLFGDEQSFYNSKIDMPSDAKRMDDIAWISSQGYADKIVIAHDICSRSRLVKYGGHGYFYILRDIVPRMRERGYSRDAIHNILVENPKHALAFADPRPRQT